VAVKQPGQIIATILPSLGTGSTPVSRASPAVDLAMATPTATAATPRSWCAARGWGLHDVLEGGAGDDRLTPTAAGSSSVIGGPGNNTLLALNAITDDKIDCDDGSGSGAGTADTATADNANSQHPPDPALAHCEHVTRG
jgi:hypothetical protein